MLKTSTSDQHLRRIVTNLRHPRPLTKTNRGQQKVAAKKLSVGQIARVGTSVVFSIVLALVVALWIRSFQRIDILTVQPTASLALRFHSAVGGIAIEHSDPRNVPWQLGLHSFQMTHSQAFNDDFLATPLYKRLLRFQFDRERLLCSMLYVGVFVALLAVAPWFSWSKRFGLRTLMITTTLVPLAMGFAIWMR
jgi:hypothetical protein